MNNSEKLYDVEKRIGAAVYCHPEPNHPPAFGTISERIAAGEPAESFEEFFAGEMIPAETFPAGSKKTKAFRPAMAAGIAAATFAVIIGGAALTAVIGSSDASKAKSDAAYDSAGYADEYTAEENAAECVETGCVSDSDFFDRNAEDSANQPSSDNLTD